MQAKLVTAFGESKTIKEWATDNRCMVSYDTLRDRLKKGVHPETALSEAKKKTFANDVKVGDQIHRYTIRKIYNKFENGQNKTYIEGECSCDNKTIKQVKLSLLIQGTTKSCGCWKSEVKSKECTERNYKHGQAFRGNYSELYKKWIRMKFNTGKEVCEDWQTFEGFEKWAMSNGYKEGLHIYLLDENMPYQPTNCLWHQKGYAEERLHRTWSDIIDRCENPNNKEYHRYGGRGIKICKEWRKSYLLFKNWALDNGYQDNLTIEKINNNDGYYPENCTWIPLELQAKNRENSQHVIAFGEDKLAYDWSKDSRCVVNSSTIVCRIKEGWLPEEAITTPPYQKPKWQST